MADLEGLLRRLRAAAEDGIIDAAEQIIDDAQHLAPQDSGELVNSGKILSTDFGADELVVKFGFTARHAEYQEDGTGIHHEPDPHLPIVPVNAKVLVFNWRKRGGAKFFLPSVKGAPATHFFRDALEGRQGAVGAREALRIAVREAFARARRRAA